jgi:hypothetical protein
MNEVGSDAGVATITSERFDCEQLSGTEIAAMPYRSEAIQVDFGNGNER